MIVSRNYVIGSFCVLPVLVLSLAVPELRLFRVMSSIISSLTRDARGVVRPTRTIYYPPGWRAQKAGKLVRTCIKKNFAPGERDRRGMKWGGDEIASQTRRRFSSFSVTFPKDLVPPNTAPPWQLLLPGRC